MYFVGNEFTTHINVNILIKIFIDKNVLNDKLSR